MKQIINCETGEITERELNEEELAQAVKDAKIVAENKALAESNALAKSALLAKLGLTDEEVKLLLA